MSVVPKGLVQDSYWEVQAQMAVLLSALLANADAVKSAPGTADGSS